MVYKQRSEKIQLEIKGIRIVTLPNGYNQTIFGYLNYIKCKMNTTIVFIDNFVHENFDNDWVIR